MDNIISYYRPNFHVDKNDPNVQVYIQKLKRKRTGGKLGDFPLTLNWQKKRYMENTGYMPCDPKAVNGHTSNLAQPTFWTPVVDKTADNPI